MWLLEDNPAPDHATLARFRTGRCSEVAEELFYQYVNLLEQQGEIDHKTVFVDGTKLESSAGRYTFCWRGSMGEDRNSYSKTDPDATFMRMKEGHFGIM